MFQILEPLTMNTGYSKVAEPPGETELGSRVSGGHRPRKRWTWTPPD